MTPNLFIEGLLLGLAIAAPVGPIGILCIQRTLSRGQWHGLATGLGAATADAGYGLVAAFGLTMLSNVLTGQTMWLQFLGGLFLCYLGLKIALSQQITEIDSAPATSLLQDYGTAFLLTLTNPMTILSFSLIFAGFGLTRTGLSYDLASLFVLGVFTGSGLWWLILSSGVGLLRHRIHHHLGWFNRVAGLVVFGFGVLSVVNSLVIS